MIAIQPLAQGTLFAGDYRIVELLSHTNHLALYGAVHVPSGEMRVLELLFAPIVPGIAYRERFVRAALDTGRAAGGVLPRVDAAGIETAAQVPFVAMEPFRGEPLAAALGRLGGLPVDDAMDMLRQVASGLEQLHAAGLTHGGLRPDVIVLTAGPTPRPVLKLLNASLSGVLGDARVALAPSASPCDPGWAAPEQISGERASVGSDVFSFALLAFTLLSGQRLWRGANEPAVVREVTKEALPIPTLRAQELGRAGVLPATFDGWFARAAAKNPHERHASALEAFADLERAFQRAAMANAGSIGALTTGRSTAPAASKKSGGRMLLLVGLVAGLVAVVGVGGVGYFAVKRFVERARAMATSVQTSTSPNAATGGSGDGPGSAGGTDPAAANGDGVPSVDVGSLPSATRPDRHHHDGAGSQWSGSSPSDSSSAAPSAAPTARLQSVDLSAGTGKVARNGDTISVRYVGRRQSDSVVYDSSHAQHPFTFTLGAHKVTKGWELGIPGMKVGGKRRLVVPPQLAYGEQGLGAAVPPNSTLVFEIELVSVD